jgi:hypothetical protein
MTTDSSSRSRTVCSRLRSLISIPRPDAGSLVHTLGQLWPSYAAYVVVTTPPLKGVESIDFCQAPLPPCWRQSLT